MPPGISRVTALHLLILIVVRLLATSLVQRAGLHALSDDDFSRITIAQAFAQTPRLDPTGTSWLPMPFWIQGGLMIVLGRSLAVAQLLSALASCSAALLLYASARVAGMNARVAFAAALACSLLPVALLIGAAPVPELAVAALCAASLLLLRAPNDRWLFAAAALVFVATLSRYEAWPVALVVGVAALFPQPRASTPVLAARARARVQARAQPQDSSLPRRVSAAALAFAGPTLWIAWNAYAHADPLHFHVRVSSYRAALGITSGLQNVLSGYPKALVSDSPALLLAIVAVLAVLRSRATLRPWTRPALGALAVVAALVAAEAVGGAPTHHPERALLSVWFVAWTVAIDLWGQALSKQERWIKTIASAVALICLALGALRVHSTLPGYGVDRREDLRVGEWLRRNVPASERVLLQPLDYGYFAVMAGTGAPERLALAHSIDPRSPKAPSPFRSQTALCKRLQEEQATWLVTSRQSSMPGLSEVRTRLGRWEISRLRQGSCPTR